MSQRSVEIALGRLITDEAFRRQFFAAPRELCHSHGLDLAAPELTALLRLDGGRLRALAAQLDPKIIRALTLGPSPTSLAPLRRSHGTAASRRQSSGWAIGPRARKRS